VQSSIAFRWTPESTVWMFRVQGWEIGRVGEKKREREGETGTG